MSKIRPPRMRMARKIKKGDIVKIKVKFNHPSFTGLGRQILKKNHLLTVLNQ